MMKVKVKVKVEWFMLIESNWEDVLLLDVIPLYIIDILFIESIGFFSRSLLGFFQFFKSRYIELIERDTERDYFLTPEEAVSYGLIDHVLVHR